MTPRPCLLIFTLAVSCLLGCSGADSGLRDVDEASVRYFVSGYFQRPPDGETELTLDDVVNRDVFLLVIEDDQDPCPLPTNEGSFDLIADDLIGESAVFRGEDLADGLVFAFDDVARLVLESLR